jgi:hypothetical protein
MPDQTLTAADLAARLNAECPGLGEWKPGRRGVVCGDPAVQAILCREFERDHQARVGWETDPAAQIRRLLCERAERAEAEAKAARELAVRAFAAPLCFTCAHWGAANDCGLGGHCQWQRRAGA